LSSPNYDDIVNKEKLKNLKIHVDKINKLTSKKNIIHKKIQLWTNDKGNEYAICLLFDSDSKIDNAQFIASTNPNEKCIYIQLQKQIILKTYNMDGIIH
jgi:hypothetical protein